MTNLATKNGSLIVKDGKLAEDCGCCGGWYCCESSVCAANDVQSVTVTISAQDFVQRYSPTGLGGSDITIGVRGSSISGSYSLTRSSSSNSFAYSGTGELVSLFLSPSTTSPCCSPLIFTLAMTWKRHGVNAIVTDEQLWASGAATSSDPNVLHLSSLSCYGPFGLSSTANLQLATVLDFGVGTQTSGSPTAVISVVIA